MHRRSHLCFKHFNGKKLRSKMAFVSGTTKINFFNLKASAKIDCFDTGNTLKELINSDKDKFEPL